MQLYIFLLIYVGKKMKIIKLLLISLLNKVIVTSRFFLLLIAVLLKGNNGICMQSSANFNQIALDNTVDIVSYENDTAKLLKLSLVNTEMKNAIKESLKRKNRRLIAHIKGNELFFTKQTKEAFFKFLNLIINSGALINLIFCSEYACMPDIEIRTKNDIDTLEQDFNKIKSIFLNNKIYF
jgi:hypothetical protein